MRFNNYYCDHTVSLMMTFVLIFSLFNNAWNNIAHLLIVKSYLAINARNDEVTQSRSRVILGIVCLHIRP